MGKTPAASAWAKELPILAGLFCKLGAVSFGGPAAHTALIEEEVVQRRQWLSPADFLDLVGATQLIPGPNSTELVLAIGYRRAGWPGLLVAGASFILPAALLVTALAWGYVRYGQLPETTGFLTGVKPVILAILAQAVWRLGRTALRTPTLACIGSLVVLSSWAGVTEIPALFGAGFAMLWLERRSHGSPPATASCLAVIPPLAGALPAAASATPVSPGLFAVFGFFAKVGCVLFGSGYVLLAFLRADLVENWHWLTDQQLLDAVAVGQFTPGPLLTTATFIGFVLAGWPGAIVATVGIFLPAFLVVAFSAPWIPRIRESRLAGAFLDGVNAASLALMFTVTCSVGQAVLVQPAAYVLAVGSAVFLFAFKTNPTWLVLGGGILGVLKLASAAGAG